MTEDLNPDRCSFCEKPWGKHERSCPYNPDQPDDDIDRVIRDLTEHEEWGT